jgi:hypothetical protein
MPGLRLDAASPLLLVFDMSRGVSVTTIISKAAAAAGRAFVR